MSDEHRCPECGSGLGPDGLCEACLLRRGLEEGAGEAGRPTAPAAWGAPETPPPSEIGPYRIERRLGEGGMGVVYLAHQEEPIRRTVALKLIKPGVDSAQMLARFEIERQSLELMDHPSIARVLDAGATPDGRPYFVMEYVDGVPITRYCDRHRLTIEQRLRLLSRVCEAVQHAHMKGVIHRDLKPSNILVTSSDDGPLPKVIDFGIAKATGQRMLEWSLFTELGKLVGTPEYMSPEQADASLGDVDTRTDVYALGVVLYELLVGRTPHEAEAIRSAGMLEMLRQIREAEHPAPSSRFSTLGERSTAVASERATDPDRLVRQLRGEIDWITMRAVEKDRERRYESARELAEDIGRFLSHEPVQARPATAAYRLRKFVRRHRVAVSLTVVVLTSLVAGIAGTSWGLLRAVAARAEAQQRADELEVVLEFQQSMLDELDVQAMGHSIRAAMLRELDENSVDIAEIDEAFSGINMSNIAREVIEKDILARTAGTISELSADQPVVEAALRQSIGNTYLELGLFDAALPQMERALELRGEHLGADDPATLASMGGMGRLLVRNGRRQEALEYYRQALEGRRRVLGNDHRDTLGSINNMGFGLQENDRFDEALSYFREALAGRRRALGEDHRETITSINNVGYVLKQLGRVEEAEPYYLEALERGRRVLGNDDPDTLVWINNVGALNWELGRLEQAETYLREALEGRRRALGDDHPATLQSHSLVGGLLVRMRRLEEAFPHLQEALEGRRRALGDDHPYTLMSISDMGNWFRRKGRLDEAHRYHREAIERARRTLSPDDYQLGRALYLFGQTLVALERYEEAEDAYLEAFDNLVASRGAKHSWPRRAASRLVELFERTGDEQKRSAWQARLAEIKAG